MNYKLAYAVGFHPWEEAEDQPSFVEGLDRLLAEEEAERTEPYGQALDLGTGSGIWGARLAERGWRVVGVDLVEKALERARQRLQESESEMRLVHGDVTALRDSDVGSGFQLVLDTGTFHGLNAAEREAMGREVSAVAAEDATVLLLSWDPQRRGPLPRGASRAEMEAAFPEWEVTEKGPTGFEAPKPIELLLKPNERWYRLRRNGRAGAAG